MCLFHVSMCVGYLQIMELNEELFEQRKSLGRRAMNREQMLVAKHRKKKLKRRGASQRILHDDMVLILI